ncbi:unnamed protein product [Moneuplotes crassus]|uniref:Uncharacterized protein n=1 Tax=Euplotes crassus TaxID=5936 RepID=A0AAD1X3W5_EUPCR|nr:unnamed protein product [Moneuplotes crassus]
MNCCLSKFSHVINILLYCGNYYEVMQFYPYLNSHTYKTWTINKVAFVNALLRQRKVLKNYTEFNSEFANYLLEHGRYLIYEIDCYLGSHRSAKTFLKLIKHLKELGEIDSNQGIKFLRLKNLDIQYSDKLCNINMINKIYQELPDSCNKTESFWINAQERNFDDQGFVPIEFDILREFKTNQIKIDRDILPYFTKYGNKKCINPSESRRIKRLKFKWIKNEEFFDQVENTPEVEELVIEYQTFYSEFFDGFASTQILKQSVKKLTLTSKQFQQIHNDSKFLPFDVIKGNQFIKEGFPNLEHIEFNIINNQWFFKEDFVKHALNENQSIRYLKDNDGLCSCTTHYSDIITIKAHDIYIYAACDEHIKMFKVKEFACGRLKGNMSQHIFYHRIDYQKLDEDYLAIPALQCSNFIEISEVQTFSIKEIRKYLTKRRYKVTKYPFFKKIKKHSKFLEHVELMMNYPDHIIIENKNIGYVCGDNYSPIVFLSILSNQHKIRNDWVFENCNLSGCKTIDLCYNDVLDSKTFKKIISNFKSCPLSVELNIHIYTVFSGISKEQKNQLVELLSLKPACVFLNQLPGLDSDMIELLSSIPVRGLEGVNSAENRYSFNAWKPTLISKKKLLKFAKSSFIQKKDFRSQLELKWN